MAGFSTAVRRSGFTTRFRPPVPLVCCSFRSWFVSRFRFVRSVRFQFVSISSCRLFRFVRFELIFLCCACSHAFYLIISRVYYTRDSINFKWIFYRKTCSFYDKRGFLVKKLNNIPPEAFSSDTYRPGRSTVFTVAANTGSQPDCRLCTASQPRDPQESVGQLKQIGYFFTITCLQSYFLPSVFIHQKAA